MFSLTGEGFQITFQNGVTVSVQFGSGHYCSNRGPIGSVAPSYCPNAEVAIWGASKKCYLTSQFFGGDNVEGWLTSEQVLEALNWAAAQPKEEITE